MDGNQAGRKNDMDIRQVRVAEGWLPRNVAVQFSNGKGACWRRHK